MMWAASPESAKAQEPVHVCVCLLVGQMLLSDGCNFSSGGDAIDAVAR